MTNAKSGGWKAMRGQSEGLRRRLRELRDVVRSQLQQDKANEIGALKALTAELDAWESDFATALPQLRALLAKLEPDAQRRAEQFETLIAHRLREEGLVVHGETSPLIVEGIVHVETDLVRGWVTANSQVVTELTSATVIAAVHEELARLRKLITPPTEMLKQLSVAYDQEMRSNQKAQGTQASTANLLSHIVLMRQPATFRADPRSSNFRDYPRELFRADLYTLLESGIDTQGDRRMRTASGSDKSGAVFMLIPALQRAAHLGRLWFEVTSP